MANRTVKLEDGDPVTGVIKIPNHGKTEIDSSDNFRKVTWDIKHPNSNKIKSFRIEGKTTVNPFEQPIPADFRTNLKLDVSKGADIEWEYTIYWKDATNTIVPPFDPLISIKPSKDLPPIFKILGSILILLGVGLASFTFLNSHKRKLK